MNFSIHTDTVKKITSGNCLARNKDSILSNYLVIIKNNTISLISSNETTQMQLSEPINSEIECQFLVKPDLFDRLKLLNGDISFKLEEHLLRIKSGHYESTAKIFDIQDYPIEIINNFKTVGSFNSKDISELTKASIASIAKPDISYEFTGVLIDISEKKASFVATNRTRLLWISKSIEDDINFYCIVENNSQLDHLLKSEDKINLLYKSDGENIINVAFQGSNWIIISKTINGKFPQYQAITIDQSPEVQCISFDKELLKNSLLKVMVLSDNKSLSAIKFDIGENNVKLSTVNEEGEIAEDIIEFTSCNHKPINLIINGHYVVDFLNTIQSDTVNFYYKEETKPIELKAMNENNVEYVYIMTIVK